MARPRKVRVFRDRKKSPSWYVEWRDMQGKRHCESCGPARRDAVKRAAEIAEELRRLRSSTASPTPEQNDPQSGQAAGDLASICVLQLRVILRCRDAEVPLDIQIPLNPQLLQVIGQVAASQDT